MLIQVVPDNAHEQVTLAISLTFNHSESHYQPRRSDLPDHGTKCPDSASFALGGVNLRGLSLQGSRLWTILQVLTGISELFGCRGAKS